MLQHELALPTGAAGDDDGAVPELAAVPGPDGRRGGAGCWPPRLSPPGLLGAPPPLGSRPVPDRAPGRGRTRAPQGSSGSVRRLQAYPPSRAGLTPSRSSHRPWWPRLEGEGHRQVAARLDRPPSTVRDWLRRARATPRRSGQRPPPPSTTSTRRRARSSPGGRRWTTCSRRSGWRLRPPSVGWAPSLRRGSWPPPSPGPSSSRPPPARLESRRAEPQRRLLRRARRAHRRQLEPGRTSLLILIPGVAAVLIECVGQKAAIPCGPSRT